MLRGPLHCGIFAATHGQGPLFVLGGWHNSAMRYGGEELMPCEICHAEEPVLYDWGKYWVCCGCLSGLQYQASLTPAERAAEEESIARYVGEGLGDQ